ncbi:hypothetical protein B0H14DRAFT_3150160 [Mycena olivaceomarginata]|nr:hypothetical protein B0H14DRAFT_3150160 [Mycena olivaceomarginata]
MSPLLTNFLAYCSFHPQPVIFGSSVTFSAKSTPCMGEDEFDRRDEVVPDAILRAADLLETEALGICPQITKQTIEANEYHIYWPAMRRSVPPSFPRRCCKGKTP